MKADLSAMDTKRKEIEKYNKKVQAPRKWWPWEGDSEKNNTLRIPNNILKMQILRFDAVWSWIQM
jgi:hypothetical protein